MERFKGFLIRRLVLVLAAIAAAEALILVPVEGLLLPHIGYLARIETSTGRFRIGDILLILNSLFFGGGQSAVLGLVTRSTIVILLVMAAILLLAPIFFGVLLYAGMVTRRVDALQRERDAEREAFDARRNLMLSDFAHDLRTPIMTISGYAGALSDGMVKDPDTQAEYLKAIRLKSDRMAELIELLFDYVKLGSVGFSINKKLIDLNALTAECAAALYTDIEDAEMTLVAEIPEQPFSAEADRTQIGRILTNLITNAIRHNPPGTKIAVSIRRLAGAELVAVADSGVPITKPVEELFDPFVKGDDSRSESRGSGLGLTIAKKIADMHGFDLTLQQPAGEYTKAFVLRVPEAGD